jgi:hypothetical protein
MLQDPFVCNWLSTNILSVFLYTLVAWWFKGQIDPGSKVLVEQFLPKKKNILVSCGPFDTDAEKPFSRIDAQESVCIYQALQASWKFGKQKLILDLQNLS